MTAMTNLLDVLATAFDDHTYPAEVYEWMLERISSARNPQELGEALAHALAWKDGKVRRTATGQHATGGGMRYSVGATRPNTLGKRHQEILRGSEFFAWASAVRMQESFDLSALDQLQTRFGLWNSMVIPAFVLHCLQPRVYPIVDQHVLRAHAFLVRGTLEFDVTPLLYSRYQNWWLTLVAEAGLDRGLVAARDLKVLDAGLWVLGRRLKRLPHAVTVSTMEVNSAVVDTHEIGEAVPHPELRTGTFSRAFKQKATDYAKSMTQREAIERAAAELGVELKPSYLAYPGSHFDRWRKQGFR